MHRMIPCRRCGGRRQERDASGPRHAAGSERQGAKKIPAVIHGVHGGRGRIVHPTTHAIAVLAAGDHAVTREREPTSRVASHAVGARRRSASSSLGDARRPCKTQVDRVPGARPRQSPCHSAARGPPTSTALIPRTSASRHAGVAQRQSRSRA